MRTGYGPQYKPSKEGVRMVYVVFVKENVIGFVAKELNALFEFLNKYKCYKVEIWNGSRHSGGMFC